MNDLSGTPLMGDFHFQEGQSVPVNMMNLVSRHIQYEEFQLPGTNQGFALIRIPYENKDFEMKIILPKTSGRYLDLKVLETYLNLTLSMDQTREKNIFRVQTIKSNFSVSVTMLQCYIDHSKNITPIQNGAVPFVPMQCILVRKNCSTLRCYNVAYVTCKV